MDSKQKILLSIVRTWNLKSKPEYRGFRCANCQKYMRKAWHRWLSCGEFMTPVHFCGKCESDFKSSNIKISKPMLFADKRKFELESDELSKKMRSIVANWNAEAEPSYRFFSCDSCSRNVYKAYHFWFKFRERNAFFETHFCRNCARKLNIR